MQTAATMDKCTDKPLRLTKRIGSTTYKVSVHFSQESKETMGDKILRLIEKDSVYDEHRPCCPPYPQVPQTHRTARKRTR